MNAHIIANIESLNTLFTGLTSRLIDTKPLMEEISGIMWYAVEQNFQSEGQRQPGGWPPLAKSTQKYKAKHGYTQMLQNTGGLVSSITKKATLSEAIVGTNKIYAAAHQFGAEIKRVPFSSWVFLRTDKKGNLKRQEGYSNLAVFAKSTHKQKTRRNYTKNSGYTFKIPARPFLILNTDDYTKIESAVRNFLQK